ncbi:MAG: hypothetical protein BM555_05635 [Crocinitomix sp. MedPE-SWsnd]|nr:MAG: hypothetical protein BM555_05635 [Crocinitomix sp. MedPE-SWsnd]
MITPQLGMSQSTTQQDGDYGANSTWIGNSPNASNTDVLILHDLILDEDITSKNVFEVQGSLVGTSGFDITVTNGGNMIAGNINLDGDLDIIGSGDLIVLAGDTVWLDNFNVKNTATVLIEAGGVVMVSNDFDVRNSAVLTINGTINVEGEFSVSQSVIIQGTGSVSAGTTSDIDNTATVFGTTEECTDCIYSNGCVYNLPTVWNGSTSSDWFNNNNWSNDKPTQKRAATIPSGVTNMPVISAAGAECFILLVEDGATLEISGTNTIEIWGDFDIQGTFIPNSSTVSFIGDCWPSEISSAGLLELNNLTVSNVNDVTIKSGTQNLFGTLTITDGSLITNDSLTLISDASSTARIAEITGVGLTGEIIMERHIDAGETFWRYMSSAVQGATIGQFNDDFATAGYPGSWFPNFAWISAYYYDETQAPTLGYQPTTGSGQTIGVGQGWQIWCGDTITGTSAFTFDLRGVPNQGAIAMPVTYTASGTPTEDGWNLVGNPYPSTIDWDDANWTKTNMANAIYIQNPDNQQYATYVAGASTNGGSQYIPSQQSFWVQATAASPVLTAREGVKSAVDQAYFKTANQYSPGMTLRIEGVESFDEAVMRHLHGSIEEFEYEYDAEKLWGAWGLQPQISLLNNELKDLTVHSFDKGAQEWAIPLRVVVFESGDYDLVFENIGEMDVPCMQIEDTYTGDIYQIEEGTSLAFTLSDTTYAPRFMLHLGKNYDENVVKVDCNGNSTGTIELDLDINSDVNYTLTTGLGVSNEIGNGDPLILSNLSSGIYEIEVPTLTNLCNQTVFNFVVNEPPVLTVTSGVTHEQLGNDGVIIVNGQGGTPPFEFDWVGGPNSNIYSNLSPGVYTVNITDANDCEVTESFTIQNVLGAAESTTELEIYYDEANHQVLIKSTDLLSEEEISLIDTQGRIIKKYLLKALSNQTIELPNDLSKGIYFISSQQVQFKFSY